MCCFGVFVWVMLFGVAVVFTFVFTFCLGLFGVCDVFLCACICVTCLMCDSVGVVLVPYAYSSIRCLRCVVSCIVSACVIWFVLCADRCR